MDSSQLGRFFGVCKGSGSSLSLNFSVAEWLNRGLTSVTSPFQQGLQGSNAHPGRAAGQPSWREGIYSGRGPIRRGERVSTQGGDQSGEAR
eukprot:5562229-Pyramimonas_sp.AAC.1